MSKVIAIAAPIVGGIFGGPWGAALGGAVGAAFTGEGDFKSVATGALLGYAGSAVGGALTGTEGIAGAGAAGAAGAGEAAGLGASGYSNFVGGTTEGLSGALSELGSGAGFNAPLVASGVGVGAGAGSSSGAGFGNMLPTDSAFVNIPGATASPSAPLGVYGGETMAPNFGGSGSVSGPVTQQEPNFIDSARNAISGLGDSFNATPFGQQVQGLRSSVSSLLPKLSPGVKQGLGLASVGLSLYSGYEGLKAAEEMKRRGQAYDDRISGLTSGVMARGPSKYRAQLDALMADPSSLQNTPGYTAGIQGMERRLASQGFTGSGNAKAALAKYGGDTYAQQVELLRRLAESEEAGNTQQTQQLIELANGGLRNNGQSAINMRGSGLASIGYGVRGLGY